MDNLKDFIDSIGAMAEATAAFYVALMKNGGPASDAATITGAFVRAAFGGEKHE